MGMAQLIDCCRAGCCRRGGLSGLFGPSGNLSHTRFMPNTKPPLAELLISMPDAGDSDFARAEDGKDKRLAARQMQDFMTTAPRVEQLDLKALIEDGRAGDEILDAMTIQDSKGRGSD